MWLSYLILLVDMVVYSPKITDLAASPTHKSVEKVEKRMLGKDKTIH